MSLPKATDTVSVTYTGTHIDGSLFDKADSPVSFPLNGVIPGFSEGLQQMPVGSVYQLFIPSDLGYGEKSFGDVIAPYETLIFEVHLLDIE